MLGMAVKLRSRRRRRLEEHRFAAQMAVFSRQGVLLTKRHALCGRIGASRRPVCLRNRPCGGSFLWSRWLFRNGCCLQQRRFGFTARRSASLLVRRRACDFSSIARICCHFYNALRRPVKKRTARGGSFFVECTLSVLSQLGNNIIFLLERGLNTVKNSITVCSDRMVMITARYMHQLGGLSRSHAL